MLEKLYRIAPNLMQNLMVTGYNFISYRKRYGGNYKKYKHVWYKRNYIST